MKRSILCQAIIAATLGAAGCSDVKQSQEPVQQAVAEKQTNPNEINYTKFTLDNGLDVVFHIDRSDPVVAVSLTSHVGSAREVPGRTGFAHLFEHLLFLESENLGKGGLDALSARIGGSGANGSTSRDRTNYFQTVPNDALEKMIWAEADKLGFFINTVTEPVLAKEKQVVKNEKRQSVDNRPYGHTNYVIGKNLYPEGHPYNWQVIGSLEDLQNATLDDVKQFFKRWYVPNNVTLVIAGDFDEKQAKAWVHKYFDEIPRGEDVKPLPKTEIKLSETKKRYHEDNFAKLPELTLTWPTVPQYHQDSYALDMLVELLTDGKKAPLNKTLIDELKLSANVYAYHYQSELAGQLAMVVRAFDGKDLDEVNTAIKAALASFETNRFTDQDLERIKVGQETAYYQSLSSVLGKGFQLAQYNIFLDDPGYINDAVSKIQAVTADDVWRVYNQYIKGKHHVATSFVPKGQVELALADSQKAKVVEEKIIAGAEQAVDPSKEYTYEKTPSSFDRSVEPPYGKAPVISPPDTWQAELENGLKVLGIETSEVPLVRLNMTIDGGLLFEELANNGVANLTAELLNKGTKNRTPEELEQAIKQLGASISISATKESIEVSANTLARNYDATVALLTEMLLQPRWDETEFNLLKDDVISQIQQQAASPRAIASIEFAKLLYPESHPLSRNLLGSEESVKALTLDNLKAYFNQFFAPNLSSFHVVGDIKQAAVVESLKPLAAGWKQLAITSPELPAPVVPEKSQLYFYDVPNAKQSILMVGKPSLKATDSDFYSANVMNYILGGGGFASQLMQVLRESKGYTYGVNSGYTGSKFSGAFSIYSGVRSNVTLEALQEIQSIVANYQTNYSAQDLETTKSYYLKSNARAFETMGAKLGILENMSQLNLPADYVQRRAEKVEAMTVDTVKSLASKYLKPEQMVYLVVGDAQTQLERLNELGLGKPTKLN